MGANDLGEALNARFSRDRAHRVVLSKDETLFRAGDLADAIYGVVDGSLIVRSRSGVELGRLGPGELLGELGVLAGAARSASVVAAEPSTLWRAEAAELDVLVRENPALALDLARHLGTKLLASNRLREHSNRSTIAVIVGERADDVAAAIVKRSHGAVGVYRAQQTPAPRGARSVSADDVLNHLRHDDSDHDLAEILVLSDGQRDRVVEAVAPVADWVVAGDPAPPWLTQLALNVYTVVGDSDVGRAARFVTGQAVGVVLSSGGSKCVAHVGVLDELTERGIPVDVVVGASGGALIAATFANGATTSTMVQQVSDIAEILSLRRLGLRVVPRSSLTKGRHLPELLAATFGKMRIEELPIRFAAAATDALTGEPLSLDRGVIADVVRASMAIPGIFESVQIDGRWLLDGGIVDPLPVDVARGLGASVVIAASVAGSGSARAGGSEGGRTPTLLQVLGTVINASEQAHVADAIPRADVVIRPLVRAHHAFDFSEAEAFVAEGRRAAADALDRWTGPPFR